jgi:hypothetical protein
LTVRLMCASLPLHMHVHMHAVQQLALLRAAEHTGLSPVHS